MYESLLSADQSRTDLYEQPIFDLNFGSAGTVELYRHKLPELIKPMGFIKRILMGGKTAAIDISQTVVNVKIAERIREARNEIAMIVTFFNNIIAARQQF